MQGENIGECLKNSNKCFLYGEVGHLKKDFPRNKDQKAIVSAKLIAANAGDATINNPIQGIITIYDTPNLILFDLGCIHSCLSYRLAREFGLKPRILDPPLIVSTPNDNQTLVDKQVGQVLI